MFEDESAAAGLAAVRAVLDSLPSAIDDDERIGRITELEALKSAVCAALARETAAFAASRRSELTRAGSTDAEADRDVAGQVGLARRMSPHQARRYVGFATILTSELPETYDTLRRGETTEWRALLIARNTMFLSRDDRAEVDGRVATELPGLGDRRTETVTKQHAYRLDPQGTVERARYAETERRVTVRPAPDTMVWLTTLLPVTQGVACYAALRKQADLMHTSGDPRGRGQLMADLLVERLLGRGGDKVPVELNLVMDERTLIDPTDPEPAWLDGYGPLPADYARELGLGAPNAAPRWIRRLYTRPGTKELVAMDSRRRRFTQAQRTFLRLRDQHCRTPFCGAPIRQADHVVPSSAGGATDVSNGQGLCQACNLTKQAPGWVAEPGLDGVIRTNSPTGREYVSTLPRPPGTPLERRLRHLIDIQWPRAA